ncbi:MAG: hypothetical protein ACI86L_000453, partial [Dokdonia sp.]
PQIPLRSPNFEEVSGADVSVLGMWSAKKRNLLFDHIKCDKAHDGCC